MVVWSPNQLKVYVKVPNGGPVLDYSAFVCSQSGGLEFSTSIPGGDDTASIDIPIAFGQFIPPRFSRFEVWDNKGCVWIGRTTSISMSGWDGCNAQNVKIGAIGYRHSLTDRVFEDTTFYGPGPLNPTPLAEVGTSGHILAGADVIKDAVGRLGSSIFIAYNLPDGTPGIEEVGQLQELSTDFFLHTPLDVITWVTNQFGYLSTPIAYEVYDIKQTGEPWFKWRARPGKDEHDYVMSLGKVTIDMNDQADEVFNQFVAGWGKNQGGILIPKVIPYDKIPIQRQKAVNLSLEFMSLGPAMQVAQTLMANFYEMNPGWSYVLHIPAGADVADQRLAGQLIAPWRMRSGSNATISNLNGAAFMNGQYGAPPDTHYVTRTTYSASKNELTATCGSTRDMVSAIKTVMSHYSHDNAMSEPTTTPYTHDANYAYPIGPNAATSNPVAPSPAGDGGASPTGYGVLPFSRRDQKVLPDVQPHQPWVANYPFMSPEHSVDPTDTTPIDPTVTPMQYLSVPIGEAVNWEISSDVPTLATVYFFQGKRPILTSPPTGFDRKPLFVATLDNSNFRQFAFANISNSAHVFITSPAGDVNINALGTDNPLLFNACLWAVLVGNTAAAEISVAVHGTRLYPYNPSQKFGLYTQGTNNP